MLTLLGSLITTELGKPFDNVFLNRLETPRSAMCCEMMQLRSDASHSCSSTSPIQSPTHRMTSSIRCRTHLHQLFSYIYTNPAPLHCDGEDLTLARITLTTKIPLHKYPKEIHETICAFPEFLLCMFRRRGGTPRPTTINCRSTESGPRGDDERKH